MDYYGEDVALRVLNCFGKSYPLFSGILPHAKDFFFFFSQHEAKKPNKLVNPPK